MCHHWKAKAVERVSDFRYVTSLDLHALHALSELRRARPKHPILLLSNLHDPVTSIENSYSALRNNFLHGDAGLGVRDGYGVCLRLSHLL